MTFGFTSKLPHNFSLFLWEADKTEEFTVLEDGRFLSQAFDIDIYISRSSPTNYHVLSFDVLTLSEALTVQNFSVFDGDFLPLKEIEQYGHKGNTLRLGTKGRKPRPQFIKAFFADHNPHLLSRNHYTVYRYLCGLPEPSPKRKTVSLPVEWAIYETGIGTKRRFKNPLFF